MKSPSRASWICQAVGWGLYIVTTIPQIAAELGSGGAVRSIVEVLFSAALGFGNTHALRGLVLRQRWLAHDVGGLAGRIVLATLAVAVVHVGLLSVIEFGIYGDRPPSIALAVVAALLRWSMVFFVWNAVYFGHALVVERRERDVALKTAELAALKAQLNPHFLFNALNSIRALITDEPTLAQDAVTRMARILRYTLGQKEDTVELAREIEVVDDYLALEQLRLGERLVVTRDLQGKGRIPVLLLQGLVENAIKHGIARRNDGGTVAITTRQDGATLEIVVTNPLPPKRLPTSEGTGLANMRERLRLLTDGQATLDLALADGTARSRVRIPQRS